MATIDEVAKLAGVSPATVSRVANGNYRINTDKYRKVTEAMNALGYLTRERLPQENIEAKPATISAEKHDDYRVIVFAYTSTHDSSEILPELERAARTHGVSLTYKFVMSRSEIDNIEQVMLGYDGAILCDFDMKEDEYLRLSKLKPVVSCRKQFSFSGAVTVSIDDEQAGYDATTYLISNGSKRPLFVGHDMYRSSNPSSEAVFKSMHQNKRYCGYVHACMQSGLEALPPAVLPTSPNTRTPEFDETFLGMFSELKMHPDAVICQYLSDVWEIRDIVSKFGLSLPGDISPIAFVDALRTGNVQIPVIIQQLDTLADITVRTIKLIIDDALPRGEQLTIYTAHRLITD